MWHSRPRRRFEAGVAGSPGPETRLATVLRELGSERAGVVHADDGPDIIRKTIESLLALGALMSKTVEFQSRVGENGVLDIHVPFGKTGAGADVVVTIRRVDPEGLLETTDPVEWRKALDESYGSCVGLGLEHPPQGEPETREPIE